MVTELEFAERFIRSISDQLALPNSSSKNVPGFVATGWARRAIDTSLGSIALRQQDLAHVTDPLNRLVLELASQTAWLVMVDDREVALHAMEDERLRNLGLRAQSFLGEVSDGEESLTAEIANIKSERSKVIDAVPKAKLELFWTYLGQHQRFYKLVESLGSDVIYGAFRFLSSNSHAGLGIALEEASRVGLGTSLTDTAMSVRSLVVLVCFCVSELDKLEAVGGDMLAVLEEALAWAESI